MTYTIPFQHLNKNDIASAGGKGANLGELTSASFPVPPGFVLTTEAYDTFVREHGLQQQILDLASGVAADDPRSGEEASAAIKALFLDAELPEAIREDLFSAYANLIGDGESGVAVRSSATAEDLPGASFAGQQETFLNVSGDQALVDAVVQCWASLWTARAMAYRLNQGIAPADVSLAVVVQTMVMADVSGILFTANPTTGDRGQMVINANYGLGEAIVGGLVTPDTVVIDRGSGQIIESIIGSKETKIVVADAQGIGTQTVSNAQRQEAALSPDQVRVLVQSSEAIEGHFGSPQDIEWAFAGDELWILQSRPITNLPVAPLTDVRWEPPRPGAKLIRRQVTEHMPDPLSPLFDDLYLSVGLDRATDIFLNEFDFVINLDQIVERPLFVTANGYAYSRVDYNVDLSIVPGILQAYVTMLPMLIRHAVPRWHEKSLPAYLAVIDQWKTLDLSTADDGQLWCGMLSLSVADATYWFEVSIILGLAKVTDNLLNWYVGKLGEDRGLTSGLFLRGFPSKTLEAQADLEAIAETLRSSPEIGELVSETPPSLLLEALEGIPAAGDAISEIHGYLERYGHQIYTLDFAEPTQGEDALPVLVGLRALVQSPRNTAQRQIDIAQERERQTAAIAQSLEPWQRWVFETLLGWAQKYGPYREEALFYIGAAWPTLRGFAHELGRRLVEDGALQAPDDIFYLNMADVETTLAARVAVRVTGQPMPDFKTLAQDRRALREARKQLQPPPKIPDVPYKLGPIDMTIFETQKQTDEDDGSLKGFAVSPGSVTGLATIIRSPADFEKMAPGAILVCPTTTPAWTPLFSQAVGLVTEIGGILAHGSIVAREYGIPAVMGVNGATQRIKDGQMITVDGDRGVVTLMG